MPKIKKEVEAPVVEKKVVKVEEYNPKFCFGCGASVNEVQTRHDGKNFCGVPCFNANVK